MSLRTGWIVVALLLVFSFCANVQAAEVRIGVFNIQKILAQSTYGQTVRRNIEEKGKQFEAKFKPEQDALVAMQQDIEKKSSAWSPDVKADKIRELQRRQREFQSKLSDARFEMQQTQDKAMEPLNKALQESVEKLGKSGNYTMIVDARAGLLYFDKSIDLSDTITKQLNATLK